jgi:hypothetical protein
LLAEDRFDGDITLIEHTEQGSVPNIRVVQVAVSRSDDLSIGEWVEQLSAGDNMIRSEASWLVPVDSQVRLNPEGSLFFALRSRSNLTFYILQNDDPADAMGQALKWFAVRDCWDFFDARVMTICVAEHSWWSRVLCCGRLRVQSILGVSNSAFTVHVAHPLLDVIMRWDGIVAKINRPGPEQKAREPADAHGHLMSLEASNLRKVASVPGVPRFICRGRCHSSDVLLISGVGQSAVDVMRELRSLSMETITDIARDVVATLEGIHAVGLVHMDVSPNNIVYFTKRHRWGLVDFASATPQGDVVHPLTAVTDEFASDRLKWRGMVRVTADPSDDFIALGWSLVFLHRPDLWAQVRDGKQRLQHVDDIELLISDMCESGVMSNKKQA